MKVKNQFPNVHENFGYFVHSVLLEHRIYNWDCICILECRSIVAYEQYLFTLKARRTVALFKEISCKKATKFSQLILCKKYTTVSQYNTQLFLETLGNKITPDKKSPDKKSPDKIVPFVPVHNNLDILSAAKIASKTGWTYPNLKL